MCGLFQQEGIGEIGEGYCTIYVQIWYIVARFICYE